MSEQVLVNYDGPVMTVVMNRPPANAIDLAIVLGLAQRAMRDATWPWAAEFPPEQGSGQAQP